MSFKKRKQLFYFIKENNSYLFNVITELLLRNIFYKNKFNKNTSQIGKKQKQYLLFTVLYRNKMVTMFQQSLALDYTVLLNNQNQ